MAASSSAAAVDWCRSSDGQSDLTHPAPEAADARYAAAVMARYLHPRLAYDLLHGGEPAAIAYRGLASILFVDIRGFSLLTDDLGLDATVRLLDTFFALVGRCIDRHGGTIDKFIGDSVMATFGIPSAAVDDADRAVDAARAILIEIEAWSARRAAAGQPPVRVGIGIDSDIVIAGSVGRTSRMDYTVIGHGVNVAARLQQAGKLWRTPLLISDRTRAHLSRPHRLRHVDRLRVGRRSPPIDVWEALPPVDEIADRRDCAMQQ